jgi:hypothetical protein
MNPTPRFLSIFLFARFPGVRAVLALLFVAVLSGCANVISAKVTSFNDWPADAAGGTFAMAPHSGKGSELEQRTWDNHVAAELRRLGLVPVAAGQTPRFWVDTTATRESRVKHAREPIYQQDTVYVPPYRDAAGNVIAGHWAPDPFGPRWVGDRDVAYTVQVSSVRVRIHESALAPGVRARSVFDATAAHQGGESRELPQLVPFLVKAIFDRFPGANGQVRELQFDVETGQPVRR